MVVSRALLVTSLGAAFVVALAGAGVLVSSARAATATMKAKNTIQTRRRFIASSPSAFGVHPTAGRGPLAMLQNRPRLGVVAAPLVIAAAVRARYPTHDHQNHPAAMRQGFRRMPMR